MRTLGLRLWAVFGVLSLVGIGLGVYGLVSDQVGVTGNQVQTGEREGGEVQIDVQAASSIDGSCTSPDLEWQDASIPAVFNSSVLVTTGSQDYWTDKFCLRQLGSQSAFTYTMVTNFVEIDPVCSPGEEPEDTDCGTTDPGTGEVSESVFWSAYATDSSCNNMTPLGGGGGPALAEGTTGGAFSQNVGAINCLQFRLFTGFTSDSPQLNTVQTDSATWDWHIIASE